MIRFIAKEPVKRILYGNKNVQYFCPKCNFHLTKSMYGNLPKYCDYCGQKIKKEI